LHGAQASTANDNRRTGPSHASALPPNAVAIIEPVPVAVNQAGRAVTGAWRLRFAERWRPRVDPLTGWTGGGDPLAQIELRFPDREAAERYCRSRHDALLCGNGTWSCTRHLACSPASLPCS
jgi:hypothetical protein